MSDSILQRIASGDMGAMQECIDTYGGLIWSLARRHLSTGSEAEDAVQEVFIALWENADRFDPDKGTEVTFVAMIARRRMIDRGRKRERQRRLVEEVKEQQAASPAVNEPDVLISEEARRAQEAMEGLSKDQQRVLQLAIHQGYTHEQISSITDLPLGTVKTHARRGLIRIREMLRETPETTVGSQP